MSEPGRQRIDKWLWFARFAKTRTAAQRLVEDGRVRVNRDKIDAASRQVKPGDVLTLRLERQIKVLKVLDPGTRRGPAPEAQALYEDMTPPVEPGSEGGVPAGFPLSGGPRPTKRDRREIDAFRAVSSLRETAFRDDEED
ncbi:RNA-binding protein [Kaistia algarum]|uniref:RNA-binding S4 domain-containing protein n=1 Tax=Kaistia algarum TaxID=2083279 RepID=UPI000CE899DF|nr:RNA-binding S4 domain-containing protein [Kaistia algarum]MCX5514219.1 RNA-binding S4 domain-containing protein [Kaistia algarum]PPE77214.1 RNA-binding protein [Kaistia algarum]